MRGSHHINMTHMLVGTVQMELHANPVWVFCEYCMCSISLTHVPTNMAHMLVGTVQMELHTNPVCVLCEYCMCSISLTYMYTVCHL